MLWIPATVQVIEDRVAKASVARCCQPQFCRQGCCHLFHPSQPQPTILAPMQFVEVWTLPKANIRGCNRLRQPCRHTLNRWNFADPASKVRFPPSFPLFHAWSKSWLIWANSFAKLRKPNDVKWIAETVQVHWILWRCTCCCPSSHEHGQLQQHCRHGCCHLFHLVNSSSYLASLEICMLGNSGKKKV